MTDDIYRCVSIKESEFKFYKFKSFETADKNIENCIRSTIIHVPFFIPNVFHGLYLKKQMQWIFNPCKNHTIYKFYVDK